MGFEQHKYLHRALGAYELHPLTRVVLATHTVQIGWKPTSDEYSQVFVVVKKEDEIPAANLLTNSAFSTAQQTANNSGSDTEPDEEMNAKYNSGSDTEVDEEMNNKYADSKGVDEQTIYKNAAAAVDHAVMVALIRNKPSVGCDEQGQTTAVRAAVVKGAKWDPGCYLTAEASVSGSVQLVHSGYSENKSTDMEVDFVFNVSATQDMLLTNQQFWQKTTTFPKKPHLPAELGQVQVLIKVHKVLGTDTRCIYQCTLSVGVKPAVSLYMQKITTGWRTDAALVYFDGGAKGGVIRSNPWQMYLKSENYRVIMTKLVKTAIQYKII